MRIILLLQSIHTAWRRRWHSTPVLLPGKSYGWRSLVGCSPRGHWGSDTTERLHFDFLLSCTGEGHGNPLQCPCLENPRDGRAWWAAVYGVAQSRTQLKRLGSSSSKVRVRGREPSKLTLWTVSSEQLPFVLCRGSGDYRAVMVPRGLEERGSKFNPRGWSQNSR